MRIDPSDPLFHSKLAVYCASVCFGIPQEEIQVEMKKTGLAAYFVAVKINERSVTKQ